MLDVLLIATRKTLSKISEGPISSLVEGLASITDY